MYEWRKILMYYLFHSTDHETAKNTKNTKRPSFEAEGFSYHKGIEAPTKWVFAVSGAIEKAAYKGCFSLLLTYYFGL